MNARGFELINACRPVDVNCQRLEIPWLGLKTCLSLSNLLLRSEQLLQLLDIVARGSWGGKVVPIMTFHQTARQGKVIESGNSLLDASEPIDTNQTMP